MGEQGRVVHVGSDSEAAYLRDDLQGRYTRDRLSSIADLGREIHRIRAERETEGTPLGRPETSSHLRASDCVTDSGRQAARRAGDVRPCVGRDLLAFIDECQEHELDR